MLCPAPAPPPRGGFFGEFLFDKTADFSVAAVEGPEFLRIRRVRSIDSLETAVHRPQGGAHVGIEPGSSSGHRKAQGAGLFGGGYLDGHIEHVRHHLHDEGGFFPKLLQGPEQEL